VRFMDRPLTWSSTAAAFTASGLPRGGVSVKLKPQPSHIALLAAHQTVLNVLLAPAPLAAQSHDQPPP
jgi:hypothetical protein